MCSCSDSRMSMTVGWAFTFIGIFLSLEHMLKLHVWIPLILLLTYYCASTGFSIISCNTFQLVNPSNNTIKFERVLLLMTVKVCVCMSIIIVCFITFYTELPAFIKENFTLSIFHVWLKNNKDLLIYTHVALNHKNILRNSVNL